MTLDDATIERLADAIAARLRDDRADGELIDAAEVARRFGVTRAWVYENATDLGAIPLGSGDRPRLRFDPAVVYERLAAQPAPATKLKRVTPSRRSARDQSLLPIRGGK